MATVSSGRRTLVPFFGILVAVPLLWFMLHCSGSLDSEPFNTPSNTPVAAVEGDTLYRDTFVARIRQHAVMHDSSWQGTFNALLLEAVLARNPSDIQLTAAQKAFLAEISRESRIRYWLRDRYDGMDTVSVHAVRQAMQDAITLRIVDAWVVFDSASASLVAGLAHSGSPFFRAGAFKEKRKQAKYFNDIALRWGEAAPELEAALEGRDVGSTVGPIFANGGWWVLRLKATEEIRKTSLPLYESWADWVEGMMVGRMLNVRLHQEMTDRMRAHLVDINEPAWSRLVDSLGTILPRTGRQPTLSRQLLSTPPAWARQAMEKDWYGLDTAEQLVSVSGGPQSFDWTVGQALNRMALGTQPPSLPHQPDSLSVRLRRSLNETIGIELLDRYVLQAGIGGEDQVARDSLLWVHAILARQIVHNRAAERARELGVPVRAVLEANDERSQPLRTWAVDTANDLNLWFTTAPLDTFALDSPPTTQLDPVFLVPAGFTAAYPLPLGTDSAVGVALVSAALHLLA